MLINERAFTLIEMLIVLMVISVLIILIVPNLSGRSEEVHGKGCSALVTVVQAQVDLYHLENGSYPASLDKLVQDNYIKDEQTQCQNKGNLFYSPTTGEVRQPQGN